MFPLLLVPMTLARYRDVFYNMEKIYLSGLFRDSYRKRKIWLAGNGAVGGSSANMMAMRGNHTKPQRGRVKERERERD